MDRRGGGGVSLQTEGKVGKEKDSMGELNAMDAVVSLHVISLPSCACWCLYSH